MVGLVAGGTSQGSPSSWMIMKTFPDDHMQIYFGKNENCKLKIFFPPAVQQANKECGEEET